MSFEKLAELKKQLVAAANKEKSLKAKPTPKHLQTNPVDPVVLTIGRLQKLFPKTFPKNPAPKMPLKIGIHKDLIAKSQEIGIDEAAILEAIKTWCRGTRYWACVTENAQRIDLEGNVVGQVTAKDAALARTQASRRRIPRAPKKTVSQPDGQ